MRTRMAVKLALATATATVLFGSAAQAATVRLGSTLQGPTNFPPYTSGTLIISALPAPLVAASPVDGTVVSWSFIGSATGPYAPRIVRPAGASGMAVGAGTGAGQNGVAAPAISGPFPTSLPIRKGDFFGINIPNSGVIAYRAGPGAGTGTLYSPPLADSGPPVAAFDNYPNEEEMMAATVRYCIVPKVKGKSPKAARKALTAADCKVGKTKKSKKRQKKKKVLSQSVAPGTSISDTAPIDLKVSQKQK